ncbi:MAG: flavodoxin domain-containing protein [Burkholderiaceae bacterium]
MLILVTYATVEGQTAKIARTAADQIESAGHEVILADVRQPGFAVPGRFDAVVVCAPIHNGHYPEPMVAFVDRFSDALNAVPSALITVSLSIDSPFEEERQEAQAYPYGLAEATNWAPGARCNLAGALKFSEYNYFKRLLMKRIAVHEQGTVDTSQDYELTDWAALQLFVGEFLADAGKTMSVSR